MWTTFGQKCREYERLLHRRKTPENSKITKKLLKSGPHDAVHSTGTHLELHMGNWRI